MKDVIAKPGLEIGKYVLVERLGRGGMGELWLAGQRGITSGRPVAIKLIRADGNDRDEAPKLFLDEARISLELGHQNIVSVYEVGIEHGLRYIAMELLRGLNVSAIRKRELAEERLVPPELVARIVAGACRGLHYAHQRCDPSGLALQIVHRDVSPQNLMVTHRGEVKVIDFGIALAAERIADTAPGLLRGKAHYMSPEQARGEELDRRSDIFCLGLVLYELAVGRAPLEDKSSVQAIWSLGAGDLEPPSFVSPSIPPALDAIVLKAIALDPEDRYQTAEEMEGALEELIESLGRPAGSIALAEFMQARFAKDAARWEEAAARAEAWLRATAHAGLNEAAADQSTRVDRADAESPAPEATALVAPPTPPATRFIAPRSRRARVGSLALLTFTAITLVVVDLETRVAVDDVARSETAPEVRARALPISPAVEAPQKTASPRGAPRRGPAEIASAPGRVRVLGDVDETAASDVFTRLGPAIRRCLDPLPRGRRPASLSWVVGADGRAMSAHAQPSDRSTPTVSECLEALGREARFPPGRGAAFSVLTLDLDARIR